MVAFVVSLTTIPSKFATVHRTIDSLLQQTLPPQSILLNIPKKYTFRMQGSIEPHLIEALRERYIHQPVIIHLLDHDDGPGTKLLGIRPCFDDICTSADTFVVLVDDDMVYKPYMLSTFADYLQRCPGTRTASFYCYQLMGITVGQGADGFCVASHLLPGLFAYIDKIKDVDILLYHDDVYISFYFYLNNIPIHHIVPPNRDFIYERTPACDVDALRHITGACSRDYLNQEVPRLLLQLHQEGYFQEDKID